MLDGGVNTILFPPFDGLSDEVPPLLYFLCFRFKRLVVVQVGGRGICDGIGHDRERDCCVGDGGRHCLSYGRDEDPEDIGSNGRSR